MIIYKIIKIIRQIRINRQIFEVKKDKVKEKNSVILFTKARDDENERKRKKERARE